LAVIAIQDAGIRGGRKDGRCIDHRDRPVLSRRIDDLEPRHGYDVKALCEQFDAKAAEIRQLLALFDTTTPIALSIGPESSQVDNQRGGRFDTA
jgi:hypothetical protein